MFEEVKKLDLLGLYKQADELQNIIIANSFMNTKRRFDPKKRMENKLDTINNQLSNVMDSLEDTDSGGGGSDSSIVVEPFKEGDVEKVKFDIQE